MKRVVFRNLINYPVLLSVSRRVSCLVPTFKGRVMLATSRGFEAQVVSGDGGLGELFPPTRTSACITDMYLEPSFTLVEREKHFGGAREDAVANAIMKAEVRLMSEHRPSSEGCPHRGKSHCVDRSSAIGPLPSIKQRRLPSHQLHVNCIIVYTEETPAIV